MSVSEGREMRKKKNPFLNFLVLIATSLVSKEAAMWREREHTACTAHMSHVNNFTVQLDQYYNFLNQNEKKKAVIYFICFHLIIRPFCHFVLSIILRDFYLPYWRISVPSSSVKQSEIIWLYAQNKRRGSEKKKKGSLLSVHLRNRHDVQFSSNSSGTVPLSAPTTATDFMQAIFSSPPHLHSEYSK